MSEIVKTMKLHIHVNETEAKSLEELTACYAQACTFISKYVFDHGFILNFMKLQETLYQTIRTEFGLKSQFPFIDTILPLPNDQVPSKYSLNFFGRSNVTLIRFFSVFKESSF